MDQHQHQQLAAAQSATSQLPPGFRFHPTDEELILHYLRNRASSSPCPVAIIADVDIYKFDPWDLPSKAAYVDGGEYYFFSPRDRKYPNGIRPNRAAGSGYWKATGTDKPIHDAGEGGVVVGVKKALVFYRGRPPRGSKTNWIMHEYRLAAASSNANANAAAAYRPPSKFRNVSMRLDDWVLCRIYKKSGQQASPMVPPLLADYDHLDSDDTSSAAAACFDDVFCGGLYTTTSSTGATASSALFIPPPPPPPPPPEQQQAPAPAGLGLPSIPSLSDLFDEYALAHIFDTADHHNAPLAVHPSLNHLLHVADDDDAHSDHHQLIYSPAAGGKRNKPMVVNLQMTTNECADGLHPPPPKRLNVVGSSCFDAPHDAQPAAASVLGGLTHHHNTHMLPQF